MKKNKIKLIERHIYLENWLKERFPNNVTNMTDTELLKYFTICFINKHDVEYLLEAHFLPKEEFENKDLSEQLIDKLSKKYSISKDKVIKRASQVNDMYNMLNNLQKQEKRKLKKPKIEKSTDSISDIIDEYIKKENNDELDRKIILEKWLEENYNSDKNSMINFIYMVFNENDAAYLVRSYLMPRSEIIEVIKKYGSHDGVGFEYVISILMKEYELSREEVVARIEEAIIVDYIYNEEKKNSKKVKQKIK